MQIETIELELGVVQNIGDYSNVRPTMKLVATVDETDDLAASMENLRHMVVTTVHNMVDDELEQAGKTVKYWQGPLYRVQRSDVRQCVVILPASMAFPHEATWKDADRWYSEYGYPTKMRIDTAMRVATELAMSNEHHVIVNCTSGNLDKIPALPDPGPEPLWSQKGIGDLLSRWNADESMWEELASLEWVTNDYLHEVGRLTWDPEERLNIIRENRLAEIKAEKEQAAAADDDDDYDEEDDTF